MGKDFDPRTISDRYRKFICDMILNGLKANSCAAPIGGARKFCSSVEIIGKRYSAG
jgi:hypothetical protein